MGWPVEGEEIPIDQTELLVIRMSLEDYTMLLIAPFILRVAVMVMSTSLRLVVMEYSEHNIYIANSDWNPSKLLNDIFW
jgi:hypothetical protein